MMGRWWIWGTLALVLFWLSSEGRAAGPAPLSNVEPVVGELGKGLADQSRPVAERLEIIRAFGGWATAQVRGPLLAALKDPLPALRVAAARALGWPGNREAVAALRERVDSSGDTAAVRAAAVHSLGTIGDPLVRALVVAATQDPDAGVREAALWSVALGSLVDPADRTSYLIRLAEDRALDGQLRCEALRALAGVNEGGVIEALMRILEHEPRTTIALPAGPPTQQQIMMLRYAQARAPAAWAAAALGELGARRALPLLLRTAEDPNDFFLRLRSIQSLIAWDVAEALPIFVRRLEDPLPDNRVLALIGLAKRGDRTLIDPVLTRLSDQNSVVRAQAVATLAVLGDATVRPPLEALQQKESDSNVLSALEEALSRLPH
jgi:HEAT repeat protein